MTSIKYYISISSEDSTFVIGIYKTEKEAYEAIVDFIFKYEEENVTELMKDKNLKTKKEVNDLFYEEGFDEFDFLYTVELFDDGGNDPIFDFTMWSDWDLENLWDLLAALKKGEIKSFKQMRLNYKNEEYYKR